VIELYSGRWKAEGNKAVKNLDLIVAITKEMEGREVDMSWVKGHANYI